MHTLAVMTSAFPYIVFINKEKINKPEEVSSERPRLTGLVKVTFVCQERRSVSPLVKCNHATSHDLLTDDV